MAQRLICSGFVGAICLSLVTLAAGKEQLVGVAKIDITPDYPVRLTVYASFKTESEGIAQRIWATALAISSYLNGPAILITVDNCGIPSNFRDEVVRRLKKANRIEPDHIAICSTHTHSAPWVRGFAPYIFGRPGPP